MASLVRRCDLDRLVAVDPKPRRDWVDPVHTQDLDRGGRVQREHCESRQIARRRLAEGGRSPDHAHDPRGGA